MHEIKHEKTRTKLTITENQKHRSSWNFLAILCIQYRFHNLILEVAKQVPEVSLGMSQLWSSLSGSIQYESPSLWVMTGLGQTRKVNKFRFYFSGRAHKMLKPAFLGWIILWLLDIDQFCHSQSIVTKEAFELGRLVDIRCSGTYVPKQLSFLLLV